MNALQSSFQLISPTIFMGPNDACRHRSLQKMLRKNDVTGVAVVPDADRNLLFSFSLQSHFTKDATVAQRQPRGPRDAQRDALLADAASLARSMLALFSRKESEIPLPYKNKRMMKSVLKPIYC
jgi:hypothetical protein